VDKENPESGLFIGYTDNYLKVKFQATEDMIGKLVRIKITKSGYPYNEGQFLRVVEDTLTSEHIKLSS
jgi:threonylcarbamoyladenosine tRNA methylthiotransferase MtaB